MLVVLADKLQKKFVGCLLLLTLAVISNAQNNFKKVVIGDDPGQANIGWTNDVCYTSVVGVNEGDIIEFNYDKHNVYKMASRKNYQYCDFTDAILLATIDEDPYQYKITSTDVLDESIYFASKVGNDCIDGNQKVMIKVNDNDQSNGITTDHVQPTSEYVTGVSLEECDSLNGIGNNLLGWDELAKIVIGDDPLQSNIGWTDGVCYNPIMNTHKGDILEFNFGAHNVYKMASKEHHINCNFTDAMLLANVGDSPYRYTISDEDLLDGTIYFSCKIGSHCSGGQQRVMVNVEEKLGLGSREKPESLYSRDLSFCDVVQNGDTDAFFASNARENAKDSQCTEPVLQDDGRYFVSCLSGPATMTPGGVINNLYFMHYPYPVDHRVVVGQRTWEFVEGDPVAGTLEGVTPVPVNQLYVHHLSGNIVLGQGTEGIRRSKPDEPFPFPYGSMTGDEGDSMIFHIIDLREVDDWLPCIECRCKNADGTYLDTGFGDNQTGGVDCCSNCTTLVGPTIDYRMRYNVSYSEIEEGKPITNTLMLTADISPAVGKFFEYDVPSYKYLSINEQKEGYPRVQRLERSMPFEELFKHDFFGADYYGPKTVKLLRCVGHLHVAAIRMWIEDSETGEILCDGVGGYGSDPNQDQDFLTSITVSNYEREEDMKVFPCDRKVKFVTEYNATELHTGVMGMYFIFISSEESITNEEVQLNVDLCVASSCDYSLLPPTPVEFDNLENSDGDALSCVDTIADSPGCSFGGLCDCEELVNAPESTGCNGTYASTWGDIEVNSLCANYCGCPVVPKKSSNECEDMLAENPACKFGGLCDCEDFVNAPESTGCNGIYASDMGDINVNDVCPSYCNACPDTSTEDKLATLYEEHVEDDLRKNCKYSTNECKNKLSNLVSCAERRLGFDSLHPIIKKVVTKNGRELAVKHAKLGNPSLHSGTGEELGRVRLCSELSTDKYDNKYENEDLYDEYEEESSSPSRESFKVLLTLLFSACYYLYSW